MFTEMSSSRAPLGFPAPRPFQSSRVLVIVGLLMMAATQLNAQVPSSSESMTDERVYQLFKAGLSPDELVRIIQTAPRVSFDLTPGTLDALSRAGITDDIIKAMRRARTEWRGTCSAACQQ